MGNVASSSDTEDGTESGHGVSAQAKGRSVDSTVCDTSQVLAGVRRVGDWVRASWLYRWLTKEPEPEVIVIDLRETYTIGPVIRLLDALIERAAPYWEESQLKALVVMLVAWLEQLAETRVGQLAIEVLAPPEPPESQSDHAGESEPPEADAQAEEAPEPVGGENPESQYQR